MNVSRCFRKGLQSVAYSPVLQPHASSRSPRAVKYSGYHGITFTSGFSNRCISTTSRSLVEKNPPANWFSVEHVGGRCSALTRIRCASSEAEEVEGSEASDKQALRLIMYSKPGCCLCDGLKEKLSTLSDVELEIRNILTKPEWENAYRYEIPVLAHVREDGTEETIPRLSPRLTAQQMHNKLRAVLS
ncbi:hypothetical protein R1sor_001992 [Riccia sorocarpa]|uniref:Glutaredoxin-like protein n=1 Tax=Riccia sorocarpa TaxID=122646 RepID=A0ABD3GXI2_9MARC